MSIIANARMYSVNTATAAAWRTLLAWVIEEAGVTGELVDHPPPQPLPELWSRPDLGCAFMCGYPLARSRHPPTVLAAPVPSPAAYAGMPRYRTCVVARADGPLRTLADTFGRRMAYTTPESQSGYQALRRLLAPFARDRGQPLFAATVGPLVTPRRVVDAVLAGEADAGPVDSYAYDLMCAHETATMAPLAVIAVTPWTPIPPMVGAATLAPDHAARLRAALLAAGSATELASTRTALLLARFAPAALADYRRLVASADEADAAGYAQLA